MIDYKDIPGYEGLYQVSSNGEVRSLPRNGTIRGRFKVISPQLRKGYYTLKLCKHNKPIRYSVHRLIGLTFLKNSYFNGAQINHKNGIKTDNRVENLEWVTASQNAQHAHDNNLVKPSRYWLGTKGGTTSKPVAQLDSKGKTVKEFRSATIASELTGINRQHISQCCTGTRSISGGFKWKHI